MRRAVFPGSFDPFTRGHQDLVLRGLQLFDELIIAIGHNDKKQPSQPVEQRRKAIEQLFAAQPQVRVMTYDTLTTDFAQAQEAQFILRGVRNTVDFEYERQIASINKQLTGIETVLLYADPQWSELSSSLVRELQSYGKDVTPYLPTPMTNLTEQQKTTRKQ